MRKRILFGMVSSSILSSFSFYEFKGPYIHFGTVSQRNDEFELLLLKPDMTATIPLHPLNHKLGECDLPFLYEPNTGSVFCTSPSGYRSRFSPRNNVIGHGIQVVFNVGQGPILPSNLGDKDYIYDFLKCNFNYDPVEFWKLSNLKNYESITSGRKWGPLLFARSIPNFKLPHLDTNLSKLYNSLQREVFQCMTVPPTRQNYESYGVSLNKMSYLTFYSNDIPSNNNFLNQVYTGSSIASTQQSFEVTRLKKKWILEDKRIEIRNEVNGVQLCKKNEDGKIIKKVDLKNALLNYFNPNYVQTQFAKMLQKDKENIFSDLSNDTANYAATQLNYPVLKQENYNLLESSKILALWEVRGELFGTERIYTKAEKQASYFIDKPIYSVMIGLACDNTGRKFHFVTDLGRDIEVLFSLDFFRNTEGEYLNQSTQTDFEESFIGKRKREDDENFYLTVKKIK